MDKHKDAIIRQSSTQRSGFDNIPVLLLLWYYGARFSETFGQGLRVTITPVKLNLRFRAYR